MKTRKIIFTCLVVSIGALCAIPFVVYQHGKQHVYVSMDDMEPTNVAIVFGAGLTRSNTPSDALNDRLTIASDLFHQGKIQSILVSGDNRTEQYNEPDVMKRTLIDTYQVPEESIFADYAGRRTYDTCRRAHDLWGVDKAILITQGYHLPRAIWTCTSLGVESTGVSATLQPYIKEIPFKVREIGAIYKSFIDLYMIEPDYIGGEFIQDIDE